MKIYQIKNDDAETIKFVGSRKQAEKICKEASSHSDFSFITVKFPSKEEKKAYRQGLLDALNRYEVDV